MDQSAELASTLPDSEVTLLELADRLLNRGAVLVGEATISVAGVDLIYLGLNVVLGSVETVRAHMDSIEVGLPEEKLHRLRQR